MKLPWRHKSVTVIVKMLVLRISKKFILVLTLLFAIEEKNFVLRDENNIF